MPEVKFSALVKLVAVKALVSGDKSIRITLETADEAALKAANLPSDQEVQVTLG